MPKNWNAMLPGNFKKLRKRHATKLRRPPNRNFPLPEQPERYDLGRLQRDIAFVQPSLSDQRLGHLQPNRLHIRKVTESKPLDESNRRTMNLGSHNPLRGI